MTPYIGICKLCQATNNLQRKSHIIPDFMYREIKDPTADNLMYYVNETLSLSKKRRTGEYEEYILCSKCENERFSPLETYAANVLYGDDKGLDIKHLRNEHGIEYIEVPALDYRKFKLFLLSILWRMSISQRPFFKNVNIGSIENSIREMLLNCNPGEWFEYPILMFYFGYDKDNLRSFGASPITRKYEGVKTVNLVIGGIWYMFMLSSEPINSEFVRQGSINQKDGLRVFFIPQKMRPELLRIFIPLKDISDDFYNLFG